MRRVGFGRRRSSNAARSIPVAGASRESRATDVPTRPYRTVAVTGPHLGAKCMLRVSLFKFGTGSSL